ncbi:MAG: sulfite exporter TauE/SafE family protein [Angelakisella sp.]
MRKNKGERQKKLFALAGGVGVGLLNGLLGAGGGMVLVPLMDWLEVRGKQSHATSLAVIVPLSALSAGLYWQRGWFTPAQALPYLLPGLAGALVGGWLLGRLPVKWLKLFFGLLLLWGGGRFLWTG